MQTFSLKAIIIFSLVFPIGQAEAGVCRIFNWLFGGTTLIRLEHEERNPQNCWGNCWIHTAVGVIHEATGIELAPSYIYKWHLLTNLMAILKTKVNDPTLNAKLVPQILNLDFRTRYGNRFQGGDAAVFWKIIKRHGAIPVEFEKLGSFDTKNAQSMPELIRELQVIVVEFFKEFERITSFPDSSVSPTEKQRAIDALFKSKQAILRLYLINYAGPFIDKFQYRGKEYNPISFAKTVILPKFNIPDDDSEFSPPIRNTKITSSNLNSVVDQIRDKILNGQDQSQFVAIRWSKSNVHHTTGVIDGNLNNNDYSLHAVQVVGVQTGSGIFGRQVKSWILRNTKASGRNDGNYVVSDEAFRKLIDSYTEFMTNE